MKASLYKRFAAAVAVGGIIFGCDSVINHVVDEASQGGGPAPETSDETGTDGLGVIDSEFTDAPASPGGTGGVGSAPEPDESAPVGEETRSFFTAFQIDPESEDTAGPKFVVSGDVDQDGFLDLVSAWNQSQPIQLHLQRRDPEGNISFRTVTLAGTTPIAIVAGLELGQINDDGWLDVVVLSKATGITGFCPPDIPSDPPTVISLLEGEIVVLFNPGNAADVPDGDTWTEMILVNPFVQDPWIHNQYPGIESDDFEEIKTKPELGGFTALAVGEMNGVPGDDIVVVLNPGDCKNLGQLPPTNTVDLWTNPGPGLADISELWGAPPPGIQSRNVPIAIMSSLPLINDIALMDIDSDGDLDVVGSFTNAISQNLRWTRNPLIPHQVGGPAGSDAVIAGFDDGFDFCDGGANPGDPCGSDADCPGTPDGVCTAGACIGGVNSGQACTAPAECAGAPDGTCTSGVRRFHASNWEHRPLGQVDTGADRFDIGDIDGDGLDDLVVRSTAGRIVQWFRRPGPTTIEPEFPPNDPVPDRFNFPWPVFTLTESADQEFEAIALGDVTGDGIPELLLAAEGAVFWFDQTTAPSVFDPWSANTIIQDTASDSTDGTTAGSTPGAGVGVNAVDIDTSINTLLVVDLDGDGKNDIVGTLDRRSGSGLSDDRLVWYRNTKTDDDE